MAELRWWLRRDADGVCVGRGRSDNLQNMSIADLQAAITEKGITVVDGDPPAANNPLRIVA